MISGLNEPGPLHRFILEAIDPTFGCPVLEAQLQVADLAPLRTLLGQEASVDVDLQLVYTIGPAEVSSICVQYGIGFEPGDRKCRFASAHSIRDAPYLIHTGYELFLMLEGVKPFTMFTVKYPVGDDVAEDALFEPHVRSGRLVRRVMPAQPSAKPSHGPSGRVFKGVRRILYTFPCEEWRCDAYALLWKQQAYGGWNDTLERLEGSLLGYTDAQNDWWIAHRQTMRSAMQPAG